MRLKSSQLSNKSPTLATALASLQMWKSATDAIVKVYTDMQTEDYVCLQ